MLLPLSSSTPSSPPGVRPTKPEAGGHPILKQKAFPMADTVIQYHFQQTKVLFLKAVFLQAQQSDFGFDTFFTFAPLQKASGLNRETVRTLCRLLTDEGFMTFSNTIWSEENCPVGSGYGITPKGEQHISAMFLPESVAQL